MGGAVVEATNGNLSSSVATSGTATVTVTYTYMANATCLAPGNYTLVQTPIFLTGGPTGTLVNGKSSSPGVVNPAPPTGQPQVIPITITPAEAMTFDLTDNDFAKLSPATGPCATVTAVNRIGFHNQPTQILLTVQPMMPLTAADFDNPAWYTVQVQNKHGKFTINDPVVSATFDPTTNRVTLITQEPINLHLRYLITAKVPCFGTTPFTAISGGKTSLLGYPHPFKNGVPLPGPVLK